MIIEIQFDLHKDYISCPDEVGNKINELQNEFIDWLFDEQNEHKYWMYKDGKKYGCSYGAEAFIYWLNNIYLNEERVTLVEEYDKIISKVQKKIGF